MRPALLTYSKPEMSCGYGRLFKRSRGGLPTETALLKLVSARNTKGIKQLICRGRRDSNSN
jgi:hypothetical protein